MSRSVDVLLSEILAAIDLLRQYTAGVSFEEFVKDIEKQDAVVRRLEVIGEAVKGIPSEIRSANPDVPWRDIAGARDVLIHEYFRVDLKMAWDMVRQDLPSLEAQIQRILDDSDRTGVAGF